MSMMNEAAVGISDLLTMGNRMIATTREALNDLEALLYLIERWSGQRGKEVPLADDSIPPQEMTTGAEPEEEKPPEAPVQAVKVRRAALEEVRPLLASKTRKGYRAEVKALLTKYGAEKLSDIQDPAVLGAILTEAERLGNEP